MFCPDCGNEVAEGRKFCGKCGAQLRANAGGNVKGTSAASEKPAETVAPVLAPVPIPAPAQPASRRREAAYALVVLVAILGGAGWWWSHRPPAPYKVQDPGMYPFRGLSADGKTTEIGFLDADGKVLIQPQWDQISENSVLGQPVAFSEGLCGVLKDGKWGYIDTTGKLAIQPQFDSADTFVDGLARVGLGKQIGFIDKTGQYVINPQFEEVGYFNGRLAPVQADGLWGFINKTGAYAIKPQFQAVDQNGFSDGLAAVCLQVAWQPRQCGYINRKGTFAIKPQFSHVDTFSEGLAAVQIDNKWGYINTAGKIVINPQFDEATEFSGGRAVVTVSGNSGVIDGNGKYVINPGQYKIVHPTASDLQVVSSGDGLGLIRTDGTWVVKPSKAITSIGWIFQKVFYGTINYHSVPISMSGKVLAGDYKGAMLDSVYQDIQDEQSALLSTRKLMKAESSYSGLYPAKGFTASFAALGPAPGTPDENHAGIIDAGLASGSKDGYQFSAAIPAGTSTGGANFNYFLVAKPAAGHVGRSFCGDSSGAIHFSPQGEECTLKSPAVGD